MTTGHADIDATIEGLYALAAWRTAHPEIGGFLNFGSTYIVSDHRNPDCLPADIVRAVADGAPIGAVTKKAGPGDLETTMFIERSFGGDVSIQYQADREQVCTRRVTGTETVEVPDPNAPTITVEREIVEWDCAPILAAS